MVRTSVERCAATRGNKSRGKQGRRRRQERSLRLECLEGRSLLAALPLGPMQGGTPDYYETANWAFSPQPSDIAVTVGIQGDGTGATGTATVTNGVVTGLKLVAGGAGYTNATVALTGSRGAGAIAAATITYDTLQSITVDAPGSGYEAATTSVEIQGVGTGAAAEAVIDVDGSITGIKVLSAGTGYTTAPMVTITSTSGAGAVATASVSGPITGLALLTGGSGYVNGGIRKFVDSLPGLTEANQNNLGQYIAIAVPDTTTYPGSDYYEIAVVEYTEQMHSDLNPTTLRGYVQLETPANAATSKHIPLKYGAHTPADPADDLPVRDRQGQQVYAYDEPHYLGATIVANKDVPVRIKFSNYLPTGAGGDLFLPVDTTVMGSGMGPNMAMLMGAGVTASYDGVATTTLTVNHDGGTVFEVGMPVMLEGFAPVAYNGEYRVTSVMADGMSFQVTRDGNPGAITTQGTVTEAYADSRATLHLHGGDNPWISDGTQHQWITPYGEITNYDKGASLQNVPDMPDPGDGSMTFFWPNHQSARLMFYHDHAFGITRLNVYAGEAAGYVLTDPVEQDLLARGILPADQIPLIIQDKTFVDPTAILATDPTWPLQLDDELNDLWMGHVFMPAEDPNVLDGVAPLGRWLYGPWQWPPFPVDHLVLHSVTEILVTNGGSKYDPDPAKAPQVTITHPIVDGAGNPINGVTRRAADARAIVDPLTGKVTSIQVLDGGSYEGEPVITIEAPRDPTGTTATAFAVNYLTPNVPDISMTPEAFMDTAVVNGTAYPFLEVDPKAYEFRILNASDDRFYNLQLVQATSIISSITLANPGSGYTRAPSVRITDYLADGVTAGPGIGAKAVARLEYDADTGRPTGRIANIEVLAVGSGYVNPRITLAGGNFTEAATATAEVYSDPTEVGMVEFAEFQPDGTEWPAGWPTPDHRIGGIPDPNRLGPAMVQIATEGGFLPAPVVWDNIPLGWDKDPLSITVNNVKEHNVFLGCAERADVIVDFSKFAGQTLLLYSDTPAPVPAGDPRVDYYTVNPDQSAEGGSVSTLPGYGPNVRTLMQIRVKPWTGAPGTAPPAYDFDGLMAEFQSPATSPPLVTVTPAPGTAGTGATVAPVIDPATGEVTAINVVNGGSGYTDPVVTIRGIPGDDGTGATATASIDPATGAVTAITMVTGGRGYEAHDSVFARGQDPIIVPQAPYNAAYGLSGVGTDTFPELTTAYERINSDSLTFRPLDLTTPEPGDLATEAVTIHNKDKAIVEEWSTEWGRIQTFLGVEVPFTNSLNQTSLWFTVQDPVTEILTDSGDLMSPIGKLGDGTQIWKIAHNGVDTHPIHFHLFNVQVINRVDWAGFVKPPEPNELGWKDTVRMNPLETAVVAFRPVAPKLPFGQPDSIRLLDPTMPQGATTGFKPFDANGDPVTVVNDYYNFGWEYVWHCHILSHEEMDMMRPMQLNVARTLPTAPGLTGVLNGTQVDLTWTDGTPYDLATGKPLAPNFLGNPANEIGFRVERARLTTPTDPGTFIDLGPVPANTTRFVDATLNPRWRYVYRIVAFNAAGDSASNTVQVGLGAPEVSGFIRFADQDAPLHITAADFAAHFTDPDAGQTLQAVQIVTVPTHGTLQVSGVPVVAGQEIPAADLANLTYQPAAGYVGNDSFTWDGSDGALYSLLPATVSLTVDPAGSDIVTQWNLLMLSLNLAHGNMASRLQAMVHTAIYDTLTAFGGGYAPYQVTTPAPAGGSPEAAATAAAYQVLSMAVTMPAQRALIQARYDDHLAAIADGPAETAGVAFGRSVGQAILALRADDGAMMAMMMPHPDGTAPGAWRRTASGEPMAPGWGQVTPWAMTAGNQFDQGGPPALTSAEYAADYQETQAWGSATSTLRTADQTATVMFWADHPFPKWYAVARDISQRENLSLAENARLFHLLSVAMADATIAVWDMKYNYSFWRPETAIHLGDTDGNDATLADPTWASLIPAPAFPEYLSGHSTNSAAAAKVLELFFGRGDYAFQLSAMGVPGTRAYTSFQQAAEECGRSRIYGGIHFQFSNQEALLAGSELGQYVFDNVATLLIPTAPTGLAATVQTGPQVSLTWTDNATTETGFVIRRSDNGVWNNSYATLAAAPGTGKVTFVDPAVQAAHTYEYRVVAVNATATSAPSNTASAVMPAVILAAPAAPTNLAATLAGSVATGPRIVLGFTDLANTETGFEVQRSTDGGLTYTALTTLPLRAGTGLVTYTDVAVTAGTTYVYRVRAVRGLAVSAFSNSATVAVGAAPVAPLNFAGTTSTMLFGLRAQVDLTWTDNSDNEVRFVIQRATNASFTADLNSTTVTGTNTATPQTGTVSQFWLSRRTSYYYRIRAENANGQSAWVTLNPLPLTTP